MAEVEWRVLGEVSIVVDGEVRRIAGRRQRAVAAVLALAAPAVVSADRLIDVLWSGDTPERARNSIQRFVSDLRSVLGEQRDVIGASRQGYRLVVDRSSVDAHCAADLLTSARTAEAAGDASAALRDASAARALFTDVPLGGIGDIRESSGLAVPLDDLFLQVIGLQARLRLECGHPDEAAADLAQFADDHPGSEDLWVTLALAQSAAGRQREAAAALRRFGTHLRSVGLVASPRVRDAEREVFATAEPSSERPVRTRRLPPSLVAPSDSPLVGRSDDLARLTELLDQRRDAPGAAGVGGSVVFVTGEAGIGKTRLVAAAAEHAIESGWTVAFGRSSEHLDASFEAWSDALSSLVVHVSDDDTDAHLDLHGAALASIVPELAARWRERHAGGPGTGEDDADPAVSDAVAAETAQLRIFAGVVDLLDRCSADTPTFLVLDDQHWATPVSTALLRFVLDRVAGRLVLAVTFRDTDIAADHPLRSLSMSTPFGRPRTVVPLSGLSSDDIELLADGRALLAAGVDVDTVLAQTGGNPLFLTELFRFMEASAETAEPLAALPDSVQRIVEHRLRRLDDDTQRFLCASAVWGRSFSLARVRAMTGLGLHSVLDAADAAEAAGLIQASSDHGDTHEFAHDLVRSGIEASMTATRRRALHLAAADAVGPFADEPGEIGGVDPAARLAWHLVAAGPQAPAGRCAHACATAGRRAGARHAPHEAVGWLREAVNQQSFLQDPVERARLLVEQAVQQRRLGGTVHEALLAEAAAVAAGTDADLCVEIALADRGPTSASLYHPAPERLARLEAGLAACPPGDSVERARLLAAVATQLVGPEHTDRRRELRAAAIEVARRLDDPHTLADALLRAASANAEPPTHDEVARFHEEAEALLAASPRRDPELEVDLLRAQLSLAYTLADGARAESLVQRAEREAARFPIAINRLGALYCQAVQASVHGDIARFARLNDEAFELARELGSEEAVGIFQTHTVYLAGLRGRSTDVVEAIAEFVAPAPDESVYQVALACVLAASGDAAGASAVVSRYAAGELDPPSNGHRLHLTSSWALASWLVGDPIAMAKANRALLPSRHLVATYVDHVMEPVALSTMNLAASLGDFEQALHDHQIALDIAERLDAQWMRIACEQSMAELLLRRAEGADVERARAMAVGVLDAAVSEGYGGLAERAEFVRQTSLVGSVAAPTIEAYRRPSSGRSCRR